MTRHYHVWDVNREGTAATRLPFPYRSKATAHRQAQKVGGFVRQCDDSACLSGETAVDFPKYRGGMEAAISRPERAGERRHGESE